MPIVYLLTVYKLCGKARVHSVYINKIHACLFIPSLSTPCIIRFGYGEFFVFCKKKKKKTFNAKVIKRSFGLCAMYSNTQSSVTSIHSTTIKFCFIFSLFSFTNSKLNCLFKTKQWSF